MSRSGRRDDRPPYAWLDDPAQPFGPVGIGTTLSLGGLLAGLGLLGLVYGAFGGPDARPARLVVGACFAVIGVVVVRMGVARRDWRRHHPGVDPLSAAREAGANVGSPLGDDSRPARIGRWVLVAVCGAVVLVSVLSLIRMVTGASPASAGGVIVIVGLGLLAGAVGFMGLRRSRTTPDDGP
ncbi:MAG: hypothetical protein L0H96_13995 [Humibacillus sp.]|nr:hypothetical protein [Humibacillus sp.]MDN5778009.1 hypothetical protein [Humibacillus sp.]